MSGTKLTPEKITSPFQLMAAWFSMLVLLATILLAAATEIEKPEWAAGFLVIFTAVVVVAVFVCVTLMLTKYRPHLQEGKEYAQWLKDKNIYSTSLVAKPVRAVRKVVTQTEAKPASTENSSKLNYPVSIIDAAGAEDIIQCLSNNNFNVETYDERIGSERTYEKSRQECFWIGERVPASIAIEAIIIAVSKWPHLKYLHLSCDNPEFSSPPDEVHDQIFIGGATSTAESLGLKPWSVQELSTLSSKDFHRNIRSHYS